MVTEKRIALILPNNVWFCPYVSIYTELFKKNGILYDIISWNRDGKEEDAIQYNYVLKNRNPFALLFAYYKFARFVKKTIKKNRYSHLIVFTPQSAIFLCNFLKNNFKDNYIFDYRDLSIEQKFYFKFPFIRVLRNSYANIISSPKFKIYLPKNFDYLISHNFNVNAVKQALKSDSEISIKKNPIDVLTIGGIRDYESNVQIIESLANNENFSIRFVGKGPSVESLQKKGNELDVKNLTFEGYYPKEKEKDYVKEATFLNIFYPRKPSHDTAISNRFYNALIYRKPMITTKYTTQGDYVDKYNLGVSLENCSNLPEVLKNYVESMDIDKFRTNCNNLLTEFLSDYEIWEKTLLDFVSK